MQLTVTSITILFLMPLFFLLSISVIRHRVSKKVSLGDSGDPDLFRKIRVHGNFTEYTPMAIILLALCEIHRSPLILLVLISALLVIGRYLHAYGTASAKTHSMFRITGMICTFLSMLAASVTLIVFLL